MSYCNFLSLTLSSNFIISFYILSKRFFLKYKGLSDVRVASIAKKEYGFAVFCKNSKFSLESISDEWLYATCLSYLLFGTFRIKNAQWLV